MVSARTARARLVDGQLVVKMPMHWPAEHQARAIARFVRWAARQVRDLEVLETVPAEPFKRWGEREFSDYVEQVNRVTLCAPLRGVRIGKARHSRLAQANTRTGILTFSRFAIDGMPLSALRYLVIHELAHLYEANHSSRFWALVAAHEPDYKHQRRLAQMHHARAVQRGDGPDPAAPGTTPSLLPVAVAAGEINSSETSTAGLLPQGAPDGHPFGPLFSFVGSRNGR